MDDRDGMGWMSLAWALLLADMTVVRELVRIGDAVPSETKT